MSTLCRLCFSGVVERLYYILLLSSTALVEVILVVAYGITDRLRMLIAL
ncbi:MAG: hypothetical protein ACR5K4_02965 [Sodalis sp. (in: enterobacteria)]